MSLGNLTEVESQELADLRRRATGIQAEIGLLEIRKARLLGQFNQVEAKADQTLREIGARLGVEPGQGWQVDEKGEVHLQEG